MHSNFHKYFYIPRSKSSTKNAINVNISDHTLHKFRVFQNIIISGLEICVIKRKGFGLEYGVVVDMFPADLQRNWSCLLRGKTRLIEVGPGIRVPEARRYTDRDQGDICHIKIFSYSAPQLDV